LGGPSRGSGGNAIVTNDVIIESRQDGVFVIRLNRPDKGNVLSAGMAKTIEQALAALAPDTKAVLLEAQGPDFCIGRESPMPPAGSRATAQDLRHAVADPVLDFYAALRAAPVPVIAAVRGRASGVGCALAALADICVAIDTARFSVPEMDRDIAPTLVMTALAERLPRPSVARLVLMRPELSATEAQGMGLIARVVGADQLDVEIDALCAMLARNSPAVLRTVKAFLNVSGEMSFSALRDYAALGNAVAAAERYR
jgi:enoyl-CoA hydratase/carnithine racemase